MTRAALPLFNFDNPASSPGEARKEVARPQSYRRPVPPALVPLGPTGTAFLHRCSVCGAEAGFGTGVSLLKDRLGTWFCARHWRERNGKDER